MPRSVNKDNCLANKNPKLSKEWHTTKNGNLTPFEICAASNKYAWWICAKGHEWEAIIGSRNAGSGCPYCSNQKICEDNCLETVNPILAKEWDYAKNDGLTPKEVGSGARRKVWWICKDGHEWEDTIDNRSRGNRNCPYCSNRKINNENCLSVLNPKISLEWNYEKNGKLTPNDVPLHCGKRVWWICKKGHEWEAIINNRINKNCPYCSSKMVCIDNCLATTNPELIKEWNYEKNNGLTPFDVTGGSSTRVWWICKNHHEWNTKVSNRSCAYRGCPDCNKIILKDGTKFDSIPEAYMYLKYRERGLNIICHGLYGKELGKHKYDFYFPDKNKYVEVTSFPESTKYITNYIVKIINKYREIILKKKNYVEKILNAEFELIRFVPTIKQIKFVRENSI